MNRLGNLVQRIERDGGFGQRSLAPTQTLIATLTGAVFSVAGFFMVLSAPWCGKRNDITSYRTNLTIAISGTAIAYVAQGFAQSPYDLLPLRALQGFCMGGILPALYSYVSKQTELARRGGIMGIASRFHTLANMVGPTTGGYLAATAGLRFNFYLTGGVLAVTVLFVRMFFTDVHGSTEEKLSPIEQPPEG